MGSKLFVGGLAWATDDESLGRAFEEFGTVTEAKVIYDRETNRSRGFGFVTFERELDAAEAQRRMDGAELDGRRIRVNEAAERQGSGRGSGSGSGSGRGRPHPHPDGPSDGERRDPTRYKTVRR